MYVCKCNEITTDNTVSNMINITELFTVVTVSHVITVIIASSSSLTSVIIIIIKTMSLINR